jgi:hypothetical protein
VNGSRPAFAHEDHEALLHDIVLLIDQLDLTRKDTAFRIRRLTLFDDRHPDVYGIAEPDRLEERQFSMPRSAIARVTNTSRTLN